MITYTGAVLKHKLCNQLTRVCISDDGRKFCGYCGEYVNDNQIGLGLNTKNSKEVKKE